MLPSIAVFPHFQTNSLLVTPPASLSQRSLIPSYTPDIIIFFISATVRLSRVLRPLIYKFSLKMYAKDVDYVSDISAWHIPYVFCQSTISCNLHTISMGKRSYRYFNLFPTVRLTEIKKWNLLSVEKASAAARKPNIVSKYSGESTSRRQLRPITTLFRCTPGFSFIFSTTTLSNTTNTDTEIFRIWSLRFVVVLCHDSFFLSFETDDFDSRQAGRIDQQQQQQQSSHTMYWLIINKIW